MSDVAPAVVTAGGDLSRRVASTSSPLAGWCRHSRVWRAFVPLLLAVTGVLAAPPSATTLVLAALVLTATIMRWVLRPVGPHRP